MTTQELLNFFPELHELLDDPARRPRQLYNPYSLALALQVSRRGLTGAGGVLRGYYHSYTPADLMLEKDYYAGKCYYGAYRQNRGPLDEVYSAFTALSEDALLAFLNYYLECDPVLEDGPGVCELPLQLTQALEDYLRGHCRVLIPYAPAHGPALRRLLTRHKDLQFQLCFMAGARELDPPAIHESLGQVMVQLYRDLEHVTIVDYDFSIPNDKAGSFDLIFACPRLNQTLAQTHPGFSPLSDLFALQNLLPCLAPGGELIIALPAERTFADGEQAELRRLITTRYALSEICSLPYRVHCGGQVRASLFVFAERPPRHFILTSALPADQPQLKGRITTPGKRLQQVLPYGELLAAESWDPARLSAGNEEVYRRLEQSTAPIRPLSRHARILSGLRFRAADAAGDEEQLGEYSVIGREQLCGGELDYAALPRRTLLRERAGRALLQEGDVLVCPGIFTRAAVFEPQLRDCIAAWGVLIVRPKSGLLGEYLRLFLESPFGALVLGSLQRSPGEDFAFTDKELRSIELPLPELSEQERLAAAYGERRQAFTQAVAAQRRKIEAAQRAIRSEQQAWEAFAREFEARLL